MISRRRFMQGLAAALATGTALGGYAFGIEPFRLVVTRYRITPQNWPAGLRLNIAVLADIHACRPWMSPERIRSVVAQTNALEPDLTVLLGDYVAGHRFVRDWVQAQEWGPALGALRAPLGVHAVLGNHDWWEDLEAQRRGAGPTFSEVALRNAGIAVYENDGVRLEKDGEAFWLLGLGDQIALRPRFSQTRRWAGVHDLPATLARITDDAPAILLAHEPDIFPRVPARVALTLSGHTHGGQVRLLGYSPVVPSRFRNRYAYGHIEERDSAGAPRSLIVSGGLGCSIMPVRLGMPPEIVLVELGAANAA